MPNPLYQMIMGGGMQQPNMGMQQPVQQMPQMPQMPQPSRMPVMMQVMQAMQNPVAFVKKAFPDIPPEIENNPNQILGYLQKTRGITNQDIQNLMNR